MIGVSGPWRSARRPLLGAGGEAGQATVELALVLPMLLFAGLAVLQVAFVARDQVAVVHAAREAARAASVDPDPAVASEAARRVLPAATVRVGPRGGVGTPVEVEVSFRCVTDLPLVGPLFPDPTLSARVVMRAER
ncbi:MAG: pilus assembly protein [Acidimicrobiia bacterium]|nr:pilus assembly protein [Acidimicrobiia bacterium]